MRTRNLLIALAGASLVAAGPALAQGRGGGQGGGHGGGHGGGVGMGAGGGMGAQLGRGGADARMGTGIDGRMGEASRIRTRSGFETRANARLNSRGPANASPTGIANANENSVLAGAVLADLSSLALDAVIVNSAGETVGTVSRITRSGDRVRNVFVTTADGNVVRLRAGTLMVSNGSFVTTDSRFN